MTRYLTIPQILFIHARLIDETGGSHGLEAFTFKVAAGRLAVADIAAWFQAHSTPLA